MEITDRELALLSRVSPGYTCIYQLDGGRPVLLRGPAEHEELLSLSPEQAALAKSDALALVYEPDRAPMREELRKSAAEHRPVSCTFRIRADGSTMWLLAKGRYCGDRDNLPVYLAELVNVGGETGIYQQILDRSGRMIYISDRSTHEMYFANRVAREMNAASTGPLTGQKCYEYIRGRTEPCPWCFLSKVRPGEFYQEERYFPESDVYQRISGEHITWCGRDAFVQYVDDITQTRKLQAELERSRRMYECAVGGAELGVWEYDIPARVMYCPELYHSRYGLPRRMENAPESTLGCFAEGDRDKIRRLFRRIESGEATVTEEAWFQPDPARAPVCCRGVFSVVRDENGRPSKAYGVTQNITAQKTELHRYRRSLGELLRLNPNALCTFRLNLTRNLCGDGYGASVYVQKLIQGNSVDELFEHIAGIITDAEDKRKFCELFNRRKFLSLFADGKTQFSLSYHRRVDSGESHWVTTFVNMLQNPETGDVEAVAYSLDTHREKREEEVIAAITDKEYDYIALIGVQTRKISFQFLSENVRNPIGRRLTDYSEVVLATCGAEIDPGERERCRQAADFDRVLEALNRGGEYSFVFGTRAKDGRESRKQLAYHYLNEKREEVLLTRADVTEAFRQEQERAEKLRLALREAERANTMKTEFLSNVSHDMRTPLNAVLGYTRLALEGENGPATAEYLEKIQRAGNILLSLINDTLDLSKIETGAIMLKKAPISCGEVISKVVASVRPAMDAKHIRFRVDNSRAVMATINVDALRLQEIFMNLLSNAVKFTPEGGEITLSVECVGLEKNCVHDRLVVRDTGCGISPAFLPKVFEPFSQERTDRNAGAGGSGLGLSIVKRLVELMGGTIEVHSEYGKGTEFVVLLDFERMDDAPELQKQEERDMAVLSGRRVLLCEDNAMNVEIAKKLLELRGIEVECAGNGQLGLERFLAAGPGRYDAILMDIRMPVMDGYEAARRIRASGRPGAADIPIIAMSADAYDEDVKKTLEAGMDGHIAKPIDPAVLYETLRSRLAK